MNLTRVKLYLLQHKRIVITGLVSLTIITGWFIIFNQTATTNPTTNSSQPIPTQPPTSESTIQAETTTSAQQSTASADKKPTTSPTSMKSQSTTPSTSQKPATTTAPNTKSNPSSYIPTKFKMLKDVGEAYMDNFGLTATDFNNFKAMGVNLIESNFDICATSQDVSYFLDMAQKYGIKVIMPAGAGEAEWGYTCNQASYPTTQQPVWNKQGVVNWINKWKHHPAIYAWDSSNEAGTVMPNAKQGYRLTTAQLKQAYADIKATDPNRPVMIRQNGWYYYDYDRDFFRQGNPYDKGVADIVMINTYSNVDEYFNDFVKTVNTRAITAMRKITPGIQFITALGVWNEPPLWSTPTMAELNQDLKQVTNLKSNFIGISYFKYGAKNSEWYLPHDASQLIPRLSQYAL